MRIKLHNSLAKMDTGYSGLWFLFDEKIIIYFSNGYLLLKYRIDDSYYFLSFSPETKNLMECFGIGEDIKQKPNWWKDPVWYWRDL